MANKKNNFMSGLAGLAGGFAQSIGDYEKAKANAKIGFQTLMLKKQIENDMEMAQKKELAKEEYMNPYDKYKLDQQKFLQQQYEAARSGQPSQEQPMSEQPMAQPTTPSVGVGQIQDSVRARMGEQPPQRYTSRPVLNSSGEYTMKEEETPEYKLWFKGQEAKIAEDVKNAPTKQAKADQMLATTEDMLKTISKVNSGLEFFGPFAERPSGLGADEARRRDWVHNINKLMADRVTNIMAQMKAQSRTGATGFGQLNKSELKLIQDAATALKKTTDKKYAKIYLDDMRRGLLKIAEREGIDPASFDLGEDAGGQASSGGQPSGGSNIASWEKEFEASQNVPRYAEGGVVTSPQMAMVGEQGKEFIVPENKVSPQMANQLESIVGKDYTAMNPKTGQRIIWRNNKWSALQ